MQILDWLVRDDAAPTPTGLVATGSVAQRLLEHLNALPENDLYLFSVVATRDLLLLIGPSDKLPWIDGVRYCAPDPVAWSLWLPTHTHPQTPIDLVQSAVTARVKRMPVLLWHDPEMILPIDQANILTPPLLDWLMREMQ